MSHDEGRGGPEDDDREDGAGRGSTRMEARAQDSGTIHQGIGPHHSGPGTQNNFFGPPPVSWPRVGAGAPSPEPPTPRRSPFRKWFVRLRVPFLLAALAALAAFLTVPGLPPVHGDAPASRTPQRWSVVGDPRTVDPCELTEEGPLKKFGETVLDRHYGAPDRCDVIVQRPGRTDVDVETQLRDPGSFPGTGHTTAQGAVRVASSPRQDDACERALLLPDDYVVSVVAHPVDNSSAPGTDLCGMADAAAKTAVKAVRKDTSPLGRRDTPAGSLARLDACDLLDAAALSSIPGTAAENSTAGFGHFRCVWDSATTRSSAEVEFDQGQPLTERWDGRPETLGGRTVFVQPSEDDEGCVARAAHRTFADERGDQIQEVLVVEFDGPGSRAARCGTVRDLVKTAIARAGAAR